VSESIPQYGNIIFYSLNETPIGFGVAAKSTLNWADHDLTTVVFFNQADLGEYLRIEDEIAEK
jgi:60S ribosome subunit biogenesis protein NIP7